MSHSKKLPYFFNKDTKESSWDAPPELSAKEINQLPGAELLKGGKSSDRSNENQVRASHLLIKHNESRRPSSWKEVGVRYIDHLKQLILLVNVIGKNHSFERRSHRNPATPSSRD